MKTTLLACLSLPALLLAEPLSPLPVWKDVPPAETLAPKPGQDPKGILNKNGHRTDVLIPEFIVWPAAKPHSPLIIVCPGGGYGILAEEHEGAEVARRVQQVKIEFLCRRIERQYRKREIGVYQNQQDCP